MHNAKQHIAGFPQLLPDNQLRLASRDVTVPHSHVAANDAVAVCVHNELHQRLLLTS